MTEHHDNDIILDINDNALDHLIPNDDTVTKEYKPRTKTNKKNKKKQRYINGNNKIKLRRHNCKCKYELFDYKVR